jgi:hypothetical protein
MEGRREGGMEGGREGEGREGKAVGGREAPSGGWRTQFRCAGGAGVAAYCPGCRVLSVDRRHTGWLLLHLSIGACPFCRCEADVHALARSGPRLTAFHALQPHQIL